MSILMCYTYIYIYIYIYIYTKEEKNLQPTGIIDVPIQDLGHWSRITVHMARVILDPPQDFLFEIRTD